MEESIRKDEATKKMRQKESKKSMKKQRLLKTLLVAASLFTGVSAWATEGDIIYSNDFSTNDQTNFATWTATGKKPSGYSYAQIGRGGSFSIDTGALVWSASTGGKNNSGSVANASVGVFNSDITTATQSNYVLEFDVTIAVENITKDYILYHHPKGSQIGHDSTGIYINLNANAPFNRGIKLIKDHIITYGPIVKNNIKNYCIGPIGRPTENNNNFTFAKENQILIDLIENSIKKGNYTGTLLYHSTGGLIYYKPYQNDNSLSYNQELATIYQNQTNYHLIQNANLNSFDDYLRQKYPGTLLIELSKMGGNPISPYGDTNNFYQVLKDNTKAIDNILPSLKKKKYTLERK